jgi:hypothetical protein
MEKPKIARGQRFTKVYERGWQAIALLIDNRMAAKLYVFLAQHAGHDNAVVCTYELLAEELGVCERTIRNAVRRLEEGNHLAVAKVGTANAYILNPAEVWKTYEEHKRFCAFGARTLASKAQNVTLKKRLTHMLQGQGDLFDDSETSEQAA